MRVGAGVAALCGLLVVCTPAEAYHGRRADFWKAPRNAERMAMAWADPALLAGEGPAPWPCLLYIVGVESRSSAHIERTVFGDTCVLLAAQACRPVKITPDKAVDLPWLRRLPKLADPMLVVVDRGRGIVGSLTERGKLTPANCLALMERAVDADYEVSLREFVTGYLAILEETERLWREEQALDAETRRARDPSAERDAARRRLAADLERLAAQESILLTEMRPKEGVDPGTDDTETGLTEDERRVVRGYRERAREQGAIASAFGLAALRGFDSAAMARVLLCEGGRSSWARWQAGGILAEMRSEGARRALAEALVQGRRLEREAALAGLAGGDAPGTVPAILALAGHRDPAVRVAALQALAAQDDGRGPDALARGLTDPDPAVRVVAARGLGRCGAPGHVPALARCLRDADWCVRGAALEALGHLHAPEAVEPLLGFLDQERGRLREDCLMWLAGLTGQELGFEAEPWLAWWEQARATFSPAKAEDGQGAQAAVAERLAGDRLAWPASHHGIGTFSRRIVFLVHVGASMEGRMELPPDAVEAQRQRLWRGSKLDLAKDELILTLETLPKEAECNVIAFAGGVEPWRPRLAGAGHRRAAIEFVRGLKAVPKATASSQATRRSADLRGGGASGKRTASGLAAQLGDEHKCNIYAALLTALGLVGAEPLLDRSRPEADTIYLVVDGQPNTGEMTELTRITALLGELNRTRGVAVHVVAFDRDTRSIYRVLAETSGGRHAVHGG